MKAVSWIFTIRLVSAGALETSNVQYRWQIRPADAADKIESAELKNVKAHVWTDAAPGAYQWRVQAVYHDQIVGESAWRGFSSFKGGPIAWPSRRRPSGILLLDRADSFQLQVESRIRAFRIIASRSPRHRISKERFRRIRRSRKFRTSFFNGARRAILESERI